MKKHQHSGLPPKKFRNPDKILTSAGIKEGDTLLDLGSGQGYLSIVASKIVGENGRVFALDIFDKSIDKLNKTISKKNISNVEPVLADCTKEIPLPEETVDVCLMSNVMHGFVENNELKAVMKNVMSVLKKQCAIVVIDFKKIRTLFGPPLSIRLSPEDVEKILYPYGFSMKKQFDASHSHYVAVF